MAQIGDFVYKKEVKPAGISMYKIFNAIDTITGVKYIIHWAAEGISTTPRFKADGTLLTATQEEIEEYRNHDARRK